MIQGSSILTLFVDSESSSSERRFEKSLTIADLKHKLVPITGVPAGTMKIKINDLIEMNDDNSLLGAYHVNDYDRLVVTNTDPYRIKNEYSDVSKVQKFEISEEEYNKKTDSVRAWKQRNKIGRFAEPTEKEILAEALQKQAAESMKVNDRCMVDADGFEKRGTIKYIGETKFKPGIWIGIEYDEPLGKNNGSNQGVEYFKCNDKYGAFLRPTAVKVGDYPPDDLEEL